MKKNNFTGKTFTTSSFSDTEKLGKEFAGHLEGGDVVTLVGALGSGKTTFTKGLAAGLGIKRRIISPTFPIVRSYELEVGSFYHIDLYRTESERDVEGLGIEEIINNKNNIVVIEWAEKLKKQIPAKRIDVEFAHKKNNERVITFRSSIQ